MRLIDADELKELIDWTFAKPPFSRKTIKHMIDMARTVDAVPVRHGKWIDCKSSEHMKCSVCGERAPIYWDEENMSYCEWLSEYCPNCGARMDEE